MDLRVEALHQAIISLGDRDAVTPSDIVERAEEFYAFLVGSDKERAD